VKRKTGGFGIVGYKHTLKRKIAHLEGGDTDLNICFPIYIIVMFVNKYQQLDKKKEVEK